MLSCGVPCNYLITLKHEVIILKNNNFCKHIKILEQYSIIFKILNNCALINYIYVMYFINKILKYKLTFNKNVAIFILPSSHSVAIWYLKIYLLIPVEKLIKLKHMYK